MLQRTILFMFCIGLAAPVMGAEMLKHMDKKSNLHPCRLKKCTEAEKEKYRKYSILYGQIGKEKKVPALRDRM